MTALLPPGSTVAVALPPRERADAVVAAWRAGRAPDAAAALAEHPELAGDRDLAIDLAVEEYLLRTAQGQAVDSVAFCGRFPFRSTLYKAILIDRVVGENPPGLLAPARPDVPLAAGDTLGGFRLLRRLGQGSFAHVYLARDEETGHRAAVLKVSRGSNREAMTLGPLAHAHLMPVLSARSIDGLRVVVMPFLGTATLERPADAARPATAAAVLAAAVPTDPPFSAVPPCPLRPHHPFAEAARVVSGGVYAALAYSHEQGVPHRDVKPSNVLLAPSGHPYLLDFNLSAADAADVVGTVAYMPPECLARLLAPSTAAVDPFAADVYSAAVTLWQFATGEHPFLRPGEGEHESVDVTARLLVERQQSVPPSPHRTGSGVERELIALLRRCLAVEPAERPTAPFVRDALARLGRRPRRWWAAVAAAAVLAGGGGVTLLPPPVAVAVAVAGPPDGVKLAHDGRYALAASDFIDRAKATSDGRWYACAAYCLTLAKQDGEAEAMADCAITRQTSFTAALANRAYNRLQQGKLPGALSDCNDAIAAAAHADERCLPARYTRACVLLKMAQDAKAPAPDAAVADIQCILAGREATASEWQTAACVYASNRDPARRDAAADAVRNAVMRGKNPAALQRDLELDRFLGAKMLKAAASENARIADGTANPHLVVPGPLK